MNVAALGDKIPSNLRRAIRNADHTFFIKPNAASEAFIWSSPDHLRQAKKAFALGTPVFYAGIPEGLSKATPLFDAARDGKTLLYVPYARRFSGPFATLASQVIAGSVGDTGFIKIHSNQPIPRGVSVGSSKLCNAVVWNSLLHDIDWLQQHFGPIRKVFCQGVAKSRPKLEYVMATFTLKGGVIAQVIHSYQSHGESMVRAEISGTSGIVQYDSTVGPIRQHGSKNAAAPSNTNTDWSSHWSAFETAIQRRTISTKATKSFSDPVHIAGLAIESMRTGAPQGV
ncbi:MAG: hypothetical protein VCD00_18840 [Candidatus Hydrogenedentota bacterium]